MSRIGKKPILLPKGTEAKIERNKCRIKGPKGEIVVPFLSRVKVENKDNTIIVSRKGKDRQSSAYHGLYRSLIANAVQGVNNGYEKKLELKGTGYRAEIRGKGLMLYVGFSHPIFFSPPEGINFSVGKGNIISVSGIDKQLVGQVAAKIKAIRPPDAYKGIGIRYAGEVVHLKPGKSAQSV
ncbi:MAG: 50S ribosomal protein L6 [candidate division Zixibacteria bacterium 4484_93]|nr:MAG: 50S ribosomal protein L6 [candidate division Zixibacteria bacterium 4484_93]RKZ34005.1 MAG: 50S ribosomal protein L6 [bacterium]